MRAALEERLGDVKTYDHYVCSLNGNQWGPIAVMGPTARFFMAGHKTANEHTRAFITGLKHEQGWDGYFNNSFNTITC